MTAIAPPALCPPPPRRRTPALALLLSMLALPFLACERVNLAAEPSAVALCEQANDDVLAPQPIMLPGRACLVCHTKGGQASARAWTAAGTVFDRANASCNGGGVKGVKVQIMDETGKDLVTLTTNSAGNFYTSEPLQYVGLRVRVSKDGMQREMTTPAGSGDCASCHFPGGAAGGRIYLN